MCMHITYSVHTHSAPGQQHESGRSRHWTRSRPAVVQQLSSPGVRCDNLAEAACPQRVIGPCGSSCSSVLSWRIHAARWREWVAPRSGRSGAQWEPMRVRRLGLPKCFCPCRAVRPSVTLSSSTSSYATYKVLTVGKVYRPSRTSSLHRRRSRPPQVGGPTHH